MKYTIREELIIKGMSSEIAEEIKGLDFTDVYSINIYLTTNMIIHGHPCVYVSCGLESKVQELIEKGIDPNIARWRSRYRINKWFYAFGEDNTEGFRQMREWILEGSYDDIKGKGFNEKVALRFLVIMTAVLKEIKVLLSDENVFQEMPVIFDYIDSDVAKNITLELNGAGIEEIAEFL